MIRSPFLNTASRILAAALSECLPGLEIQEIGFSYHGFHCEFFFSQPISTDLSVLVEERIRQIIREKRAIRLLEMVPFSASELLKKEGRKVSAAAVIEEEGLVQLIQFNSFIDWSEGPHLRHTGEAGFFHLSKQEVLGKGQYRLFGLAASSKQELKHLLALWKQYPKKDHERLGASQGFWVDCQGDKVWLANGLRARRRFCDFWRSRFASQALEIEGGIDRYLSSQPARSLMEFCTFEEGGEGRRGLLDEKRPLVLQVNFFGEDDCISFLQTMHKSLTILGFPFRIRFSSRMRKEGLIQRALRRLEWQVDEEPSKMRLWEKEDCALEFCIEDGLRCEWVAVDLREYRKTGSLLLTIWVERNLALLIERSDCLRAMMNELSQASAGELIEN